jgi:rhodanese-related sulfurtransferase
MSDAAAALDETPRASEQLPAVGGRGVAGMLAVARSRLLRLAPEDVPAAVRDGAVLLDIRPDSQRATDGGIDGAVVICRNVLEWRCDPASPSRDPRVSDPARRVIVLCNEGYQSSLAAATLRELGFARAGDIDGGFQAWRATGLPTRQSDEPGAGAWERRKASQPRSGSAPRSAGSSRATNVTR